MTRWEFLLKYNSIDYQNDGNTENIVGLTYYPIGYCSHPVALPFQNEVLTMGALPIYFVKPQVSLYQDRVLYNDSNFNTQLIVGMKSGEKTGDWQLHELQCDRKIGKLLSPYSVLMWDITAEFSYMITEPSVYVFVNDNSRRAVVFEMKERYVENKCPRCGYGPMTAFSYPRNTLGSLMTEKSFGYRCMNCGYEKYK